MDRSWWDWLHRDDDDDAQSVSTHLEWSKLLRCSIPYVRKRKWTFMGLMLMIITSSVMSLLHPLLLMEMIDYTLPSKDYSNVHIIGLKMIVLTLTTGLLDVLKTRLNAGLAAGIGTDLKDDLFVHFQKMSLHFFTKTKGSEIYARFYTDVHYAKDFISGTLATFISNVVILSMALTITMYLEWRLTLLALLFVPAVYFPAIRVGERARVLGKSELKAADEASAIINETLNVDGALLVKLFGKQGSVLAEFRKHMQTSKDLNVERETLLSLFSFFLTLASSISDSGAKWVGALLVLSGSFTPGTIIAFSSYISYVHGPLMNLFNVKVGFASSAMSIQRIIEALEMDPEIKEIKEPIEMKAVAGKLEFRGVSFSYTELDKHPERFLSKVKRYWAYEPERGKKKSKEEEERELEELKSKETKWALDDVSFVMEPGQLVAVVGRSGAGKTTLCQLMPRLYDPTLGSIEIDGHDLRSCSLASLAQHIGVVSQSTYLVFDTIGANIKYGNPDATDEEVEAAAKAANLHEFIQGLPEGYDTVVGERGYRLSGGERQRVSIARAILKDPKLLVLDEATSSLDSVTESLIQQAFEQIMSRRTTLVIAHRLSTILKADKILVLEQGKLVEQGTHQELLAAGGCYKTLFDTQFADALQPSKSTD